MPPGTKDGGAIPGPTDEPVQMAAAGAATGHAAKAGTPTSEPATKPMAMSTAFTQRPSPVSPRRVMQVLMARLEFEDGRSVVDRGQAKADELRHRCVDLARLESIDQFRHARALLRSRRRSSRTVGHRAAVDDHLLLSRKRSNQLHPDRVPDGLQLEEGGDLIWTL